jgi:hypothetical protein
MKGRDMQILDCCLVMNSQMKVGFKGLISICNTTITDFSSAVYCGQDSIVFTENSSIVNNRGVQGIYLLNPKLVKVMKTSFIKCEGNAVSIDQETFKHFNDLEDDNFVS